MVARARVPSVPCVSATASSSASAPATFVVVAHARSTPMHVAHNSLSDPRVGVNGPTGRRSGGVSRSRPKICALSLRWRQG